MVGTPFVFTSFFARREEHGQITTFQHGLLVDVAAFGQSIGKALEQGSTDILVCHLTALELNHYLHFIAVREEAARLINLGVEIVGIDFAGQLNFLHVDLLLLLFVFFFFLVPVKTEFAVVHDATHSGGSLCYHQYQVHVLVVRHIQRLGQGNDADLVVVGSDHTYIGLFGDAGFVDDLLVDVVFFCIFLLDDCLSLPVRKIKNAPRTILRTQNSRH